MAGKFGFAIDRGGTFTDVYVRRPDGSSRVLKLLSEDPANYKDAPTEGIRRILEQELGKSIPPSSPIDTSHIAWIRMGTTVATNALLERKGERMALLVTKGFRDLIFIGNQSRPKIFDLKIEMPGVLYDEIVEVEERIVIQQEKCELKSGAKIVNATTGDKLELWQALNKEDLTAKLKAILNKGITSLAVLLLHSYMYPHHEKQIEELATSLGFTNVSLSSVVMPMIKAVPRGFTACADAYLTPVIKKYLAGFTSGFKDNLKGVRVLFMQSDGGLCPLDDFCGSRAILSGPAGGVVGIAMTSYNQQTKHPVIGFDMGGTSTDVSRYAGEFDHVFESTTAGITIQAPQLDVNTVAAGGGSKLFFRSGMFVVGPDSVGANPGPACYKKGGDLAITDANLVLGRVLPEYFPKIFGPKANEPLDYDGAIAKFKELTDEINKFNASENTSRAKLSLQEVALGFADVANEAMCRPIRTLTQAKGYDTSRHVLACFGGAGAQHCCAVAKSLGIKTVFVHRYAAILSAYGLALADVVHEEQEPCHAPYAPDNFAQLDDRIDHLAAACEKALLSQGFSREQLAAEPYLHLRYDRTDCALMCKPHQDGQPANHAVAPKHGDFLKSFTENYKREFGFTIPERTIIVDDIRVRGIARSGVLEKRKLPAAKSTEPTPTKQTKCFFKEGSLDTSVFLLQELQFGHAIQGPAIVVDVNSTIVIEPGCVAKITEEGDVRIEIGDIDFKSIGVDVDPIQLSIFSHRFMSIAEQMGRILQRTAISTNIKERLDFSCALFGPDGGLIANAPHIPVHLGSMQETVRFQIQNIGKDMKNGDVYLSNHPQAGGTHLPDLTVITPVYYKNSKLPVFFVASRGHHADIGGLVPGSMPPHSTSLNEEGATFVSFKLVDGGDFREAAVIEALNEPAKFRNCTGTRNLDDNLSDLRAQVAANQKGINLVCELIDAYGLDVVQAYMAHIQASAEIAVRDLLKDIAANRVDSDGSRKLHAVDFMDDGIPIELTITLNPHEGEATFDFAGTGWEVYGNCNAPKAVTYAAVIYCIRCMVGHDIPLNQGCLNPISIVLPENSILKPSPEAAVVGGNVQTSQRLVDVIFKAFGTCAASQGDMNNVTFGNEEFGYYETVAGGHGAGPTWHGHSGIHTHMTNTRITDPEILERRYPIVLEKFCLRNDSGGKGKFRGGEGVIREYLFRRPLTLSIMTERRVFAPYGLNGGCDGAKGLNLIRFKSGRIVSLGSKKSIAVEPGDRFKLQTPGGGGWGSPDEADETSSEQNDKSKGVTGRAVRAAGSLIGFQLTQESA